MAITKRATSLELSRKTGPRIFVEKYITGISDITEGSYLARFRRLVGQTVQLQPHILMFSIVERCMKVLTSFPDNIIFGLE
jgi:hypothetical protein